MTLAAQLRQHLPSLAAPNSQDNAAASLRPSALSPGRTPGHFASLPADRALGSLGVVSSLAGILGTVPRTPAGASPSTTAGIHKGEISQTVELSCQMRRPGFGVVLNGPFTAMLCRFAAALFALTFNGDLSG